MAQEFDWRPPTGDIPTNPGVYRFFDASGRVLYVGKAINLRSRLTNYFGPLRALHERTRRMVTTARNVKWVIVGSEMEALQLEYTWIKEFDPPFNVQFKDDKSYPYVAMTMGEEFPRVHITRGKRHKGDVFLGPYTKTWAARETVDDLLKVFPMRSCTKGVFNSARRNNKPCLLGDIGKCSAPCVGRVTPEQHRKIADDFLAFMTGHDRTYSRELKQKMQQAASDQEYEMAAEYRDKLLAVQHVLQKTAVVLSEDTNADVFGVKADNFTASVHVFIVRQGRVRGVRNWYVDLELEVSAAELSRQALLAMYGDDSEIPREILVDTMPDDSGLVTSWLSEKRGKPVHIHVPERGKKHAICATAVDNATAALQLYQRRRSADFLVRSEAMKNIQDALGLAEAPLRIECFDISHLGGEDVVASMVVFEDGLPKKADYRKYHIAHTTDDTESMRQILTRRYSHLNDPLPKVSDDAVSQKSEDPSAFSFRKRPNLLVVDGGLPQVHAAQAALAAIGQQDIAVCGMAKRLEEVWVAGEEYPVILPRNSEALFLLQHVRDEAHRFAITFQRNTRTKRMHTELTGVPGLGETRALKLLRKFGSVGAIANASAEQLCSVEGVGPKLASEVLAWCKNRYPSKDANQGGDHK